MCVFFFSILRANRCYNRILRLSDRQFSQLNTQQPNSRQTEKKPPRFCALGKGKSLHDLSFNKTADVWL